MKNILICAVAVLYSTSCSTGIESTKKIRMSKEDVKLMAKTPEQTFATDIQGSPLSSWEKGKQFLALSERTSYIFEPTGRTNEDSETSMAGKTLTFKGTDTHLNPDLSRECVLIFSDGTTDYRYRTGKTPEQAMKETDSSKLPLLSDLTLIDRWKEKLLGATLWTRSNLWYDSKGARIPGMKFAEVKVSAVEPTTGDFPIRIRISAPDGTEGYMHMNYTSDIHDSRNFAALFFLSDPKQRYPNITDEHWALIQRGKLGEGMTKEECKLSIGNPDDAYSGHSRSQTIDIWEYTDGTTLFFSDGLLSNFRH